MHFDLNKNDHRAERPQTPELERRQSGPSAVQCLRIKSVSPREYHLRYHYGFPPCKKILLFDFLITIFEMKEKFRQKFNKGVVFRH